MNTLHIIEPTLHDQTGHCCGYVTSLLEANQPALWQACRNMISDYATFQTNAYQAGKQLRQEHDPRRTLELLQRRLFIKGN